MNSLNFPDIEPGSIFISRDLPQDSLIRVNLSKLGFKITDCSLLHISQIRFSYSPLADWIFFSSKNAIKYFFAQNPTILRKTRFGVFGKSSARYLMEFARKADFIGEGNNAPNIALAFAKLIHDETVLFPMAIDSMQTVQRRLAYNNIAKNLYVYKTELKTNFTLPKTEYLVFTSPSNVTAYFSKYTISPAQKVVALGTTTQQKLQSFGIQNIAIPDSFEEESLLQKIWQVSSSS